MHTITYTCGHKQFVEVFDNRRPQDQLEVTSVEPCDACKGVFTYVAYVDGGCGNNQHQELASAYYSAAIIRKDGMAMSFTLEGVKSSVHDHIPVAGKQTNQVAEVTAMTQILGYIALITKQSKAAGKQMARICIKCDSEYAIKWAVGANKKHKANKQLTEQLSAIAKCVPEAVQIIWVPREEIEEVLGH